MGAEPAGQGQAASLGPGLVLGRAPATRGQAVLAAESSGGVDLLQDPAQARVTAGTPDGYIEWRMAMLGGIRRGAEAERASVPIGSLNPGFDRGHCGQVLAGP